MTIKNSPTLSPTIDQTAQPKERSIVVAVQRALQGKLNIAGSFTLTANTTSTIVVDPRVGSDSVVLTMPKSANAAAENLYITIGNDAFTVVHANTATTDRNFDYVVLG